MGKVQNDITMTEETELPDDLEVLRSIYPEIQVQNGGSELALEIKLEPESKINVILQSSVGKELGRFQTKYFEPLSPYFAAHACWRCRSGIKLDILGFIG